MRRSAFRRPVDCSAVNFLQSCRSAQGRRQTRAVSRVILGDVDEGWARGGGTTHAGPVLRNRTGLAIWGPSVTRSATFPRGPRLLSPAGSVGSIGISDGRQNPVFLMPVVRQSGESRQLKHFSPPSRSTPGSATTWGVRASMILRSSTASTERRCSPTCAAGTPLLTVWVLTSMRARRRCACSVAVSLCGRSRGVWGSGGKLYAPALWTRVWSRGAEASPVRTVPTLGRAVRVRRAGRRGPTGRSAGCHTTAAMASTEPGGNLERGLTFTRPSKIWTPSRS